MTGLPSNVWGSEAPRQHELARLRTFCALNGGLYLGVAVLVAFLRLLIGEPVEMAFLVQDMLCAVALITLAALLFWVRGVIVRDPVGRGPAVAAGRAVRTVAVINAVVCLSVAAVVLVPAKEASKFPTIAVTAFVVLAALYTYAGMTKLRPAK